MLRDFSPEELSYMATSFAVALTKDLDNASVKVMCNFFVQVVGTLNLIIGQRALLKDHDHHEEHDCHGHGEPPNKPGKPEK